MDFMMKMDFLMKSGRRQASSAYPSRLLALAVVVVVIRFLPDSLNSVIVYSTRPQCDTPMSHSLSNRC